MPYEQPWPFVAAEHCYFYHTVDVPDGVVSGTWDLRPVADQYTGHCDFGGKRVLDIGTATGFLSYYAEQRGASEVVSFDCDGNFELLPDWLLSSDVIQRQKNGYWHCHHLRHSRCKAWYGDVYNISVELGQFDVAILGSILLHLENPFGALRSAAQHANRLVVVEAHRPYLKSEDIIFRPFYGKQDFLCWWYLPVKPLERMLASLGFKTEPPEFFTATGPSGGSIELYTLVATK